MDLNRAFSAMLLLLIIPSLSIAQEMDSLKTDDAPDTVRVGAYVISVHDINFHEKEYTMRFWLWFLYDNPDFDFESQLDIPNAKTIDPPEIIIDSLEGKAWVIMKMKCTMKERWNVASFPFDQQHLTVEIENTLFDNKSLVFVPDRKGSRFDEKETIDGWIINNFHVSVADNEYKTGFGDIRPVMIDLIFLNSELRWTSNVMHGVCF